MRRMTVCECHLALLGVGIFLPFSSLAIAFADVSSRLPIMSSRIGRNLSSRSRLSAYVLTEVPAEKQLGRFAMAGLPAGTDAKVNRLDVGAP
jgi:hypothetical protein